MNKHTILSWLPQAIASTIILLVVYGAVQQNIRQSANSPQIQLAEDGGAILAQGIPPFELLGNSRVDIVKSLSPFAIIYSASGTPMASSGYLKGSVPVIPSGVLEYARSHGEDRLTWQPAPDTRIAAVVSYYHGSSTGYILVGRSLREAEALESSIVLMTGAALIILLVTTFLASLYAGMVREKKSDSLV